MEGITFSRLIYNKGNGFQRVGLDGKEEEAFWSVVRELHKKQMEDSLNDADAILQGRFGRATLSDVVHLACAFFERRAPATYTVYQEFLARKVDSIKNGNGDAR